MITPSLREQFERLAMRLNELDANLADPQISADVKRWRGLSREQAEVAHVVGLFRRYQGRESDLGTARDMLADRSLVDADMQAMARDEVSTAGADLERLNAELQAALLPRDLDDERNAFLEIRAGTGGDESALFAGDLARMYLRFCERQGWRTEVLSENTAELGGYKELVLRIEGQGVYAQLRFESGGHRVQRVPVTEAQGRIHTSACTVAVMPEPDGPRSCRSTRPNCASTPSAPAAPAASMSTRPTAPSASPTCRPASWPSARMTARSTATRPRRWRS